MMWLVHYSQILSALLFITGFFFLDMILLATWVFPPPNPPAQHSPEQWTRYVAEAVCFSGASVIFPGGILWGLVWAYLRARTWNRAPMIPPSHHHRSFL